MPAGVFRLAAPPTREESLHAGAFRGSNNRAMSTNVAVVDLGAGSAALGIEGADDHVVTREDAREALAVQHVGFLNFEIRARREALRMPDDGGDFMSAPQGLRENFGADVARSSDQGNFHAGILRRLPPPDLRNARLTEAEIGATLSHHRAGQIVRVIGAEDP